MYVWSQNRPEDEPNYIDLPRGRYCKGSSLETRRTMPNPFTRCEIRAEKPRYSAIIDFSAVSEDQLPRITDAVDKALRKIIVPCSPDHR